MAKVARQRPPRYEWTEADVARAAERWLASNGWVVYREVSDGYGSARADLVGLQFDATHVVECKTRLSLDLIEQAHGWLKRSEEVSVCVVARTNTYDRLPIVVMKQLGIGLLSVSPDHKPEWAGVRVEAVARWHRVRRDDDHIRARLFPEQRGMGEAGTNRGGYVTPFRLWMRDVAEFVAANPGASVSEVIAGKQHMYSNDKAAKRALNRALFGGWCDGVRIDDERRCWPTASRDGGDAKGGERG